MALSIFTANHLSSQKPLVYPLAKKDTVADTYFGTKVADPYRWLEDDRSEATEAWVKAQNICTENYLKESKSRLVIKERLTELWNYNKQSAPFKKGNSFFCYKNNGLQNQSVLYRLSSLTDAGDILLDPNTLSQDGTVSLSGTSISKDGKTLAYGISKAGSDWVEIHFKDIATKKDLPDVIKWVKFSGMAWRGNGIYYSRYAEQSGSGRSQKNQFHKVYFHQLGLTQQEDVLIYEDKDHPDYNFGAFLTENENYLFLSISESTSGEMLYVKDLANEKAGFKMISGEFDFDYSIIYTVCDEIRNISDNNVYIAGRKARKEEDSKGNKIIKHSRRLYL